jgi:hypothetical protein
MAKKRVFKEHIVTAVIINHQLYVMDFVEQYESVEHAIFAKFGIDADNENYHVLWSGPRYHIG